MKTYDFESPPFFSQSSPIVAKSLFISLDCGSHCLQDATVSQCILFVSMQGRVGCVFLEFAFKYDIMVVYCTTQAQVQPQYVTTLNNVQCILEFVERAQIVDVRRSLE